MKINKNGLKLIVFVKAEIIVAFNILALSLGSSSHVAVAPRSQPCVLSYRNYVTIRSHEAERLMDYCPRVCIHLAYIPSRACQEI